MMKQKKKPSTELSLENFQKNLNANKKKEKKIVDTNTNTKFPLDVFPKRIQDIINDFHKANQLPIDYYGLGLLTICGAVIGNAYVLRYKNGQLYSPVIYACIIGNSSIGKSPVLNLLLKPIFNIESKYDEEYQKAIEQWEFENKGKKKKDFTNKPKRKNILLSDATIESIHQAHQTNARGLISFNDELVAWLNSQNQYRNGSDNEFWLSAWSGSTVKVNRVTKDVIFIQNPSIAVLGGIQPKVLKSLVRKDNKDNGFLYRILFAFPDNVKKPYETEYEIDDLIESDYHKIIKMIFELESNLEQDEKNEIPINPEAKRIFINWKNNLTDEINNSNDDSISSLYGKIESYCLRFALILHILELVCEKEVMTAKGTEVSKEIIEKAIKLTEYFKYMGLKVLDRIEISNPFQDLSKDFIKCYKALPEQFKTNQGIVIANKFGIAKRSFQRNLSKQTQLFQKLKHGVYKKLV